MPQQPVQHSRQPAKQARATKQVLGEVGYQAEQQAQANQVDAALTYFNASPQLPEPHAVHGNVQKAEVDQHRGEQSPPLPRRQAVGQRDKLDVLASNAEIEKRQPAQGRQVVPQLGHCSDDYTQQQDDPGGRAGTQLLGETGPGHGCRALNDGQFVLGVTHRKTLVQTAHIVGDVLWRPQHLLARLFADPMRYLHAPEQRDKTAQVDGQRQT